MVQFDYVSAVGGAPYFSLFFELISFSNCLFNRSSSIFMAFPAFLGPPDGKLIKPESSVMVYEV
jgi:hypothetical protein